MKLYKINQAIQQVIDQIEFDPETGEILCDSEALFAELNPKRSRWEHQAGQGKVHRED